MTTRRKKRWQAVVLYGGGAEGRVMSGTDDGCFRSARAALTALRERLDYGHRKHPDLPPLRGEVRTDEGDTIPA